MARKSNEQSLGDVIKDMLKAYRLEGRMKEYDVREAWRQVMGDVVDRKTRNVRLKGNILSVTLDSGVMKEEFSYGKTRIMNMINEHLGEELIKDVEIY